jgi:hypothetical protein
MPNGSVIVKQGYTLVEDADAGTSHYELKGTLVMAKISALDPNKFKGNWFFVKIEPNGIAAPNMTTCGIKCHSGETQKTLWPVAPENNGGKGGKPDALVPYDYLYLPFCTDPRSEECSGPT